jgi:hypothetical protein
MLRSCDHNPAADFVSQIWQAEKNLLGKQLHVARANNPEKN